MMKCSCMLVRLTGASQPTLLTDFLKDHVIGPQSKLKDASLVQEDWRQLVSGMLDHCGSGDTHKTHTAIQLVDMAIANVKCNCKDGRADALVAAEKRWAIMQVRAAWLRRVMFISNVLMLALRSPHKRGLRHPAAMDVARHVLERVPRCIEHMLGGAALGAGCSGALPADSPKPQLAAMNEYTGIIADLAAERSLGIDGKLGSSAPEWLLPACAELCAALSGGGSQWATALASTGGAPALALAAAACESQGQVLALAELACVHVFKKVRFGNLIDIFGGD
eukprot:361276-Chlamydomonas_euryale.AAC.3